MSHSLEIDRLLNAPASNDAARQLVEWADTARHRIVRGEMMIGILTFDEVAKIPSAYQAAAEQGIAEAWVKLAWWYAHPQFGDANLEAAEVALQRAIKANMGRASVEMAKIRWYFKRDTATEVEQAEAYRATLATVESCPQDAETICLLAHLTTAGFGTAASPAAGYKLHQQGADLGNSDSMFEIYVHHAHGLGVPLNEHEAFLACQRAANAGHSRAMYNLGAFNAIGKGIARNIPEAIKWYERAADAGNPAAMAGLAMIFATGDGVEPDREYAQQLFDQADYCGLDVTHLREQVGL